jgi:hypothetical protein
MTAELEDRLCWHIRSDPYLPLNCRDAVSSGARSNDRYTLFSGGRRVVGSVGIFSAFAGAFSKPMEQLRHVLELHRPCSFNSADVTKAFRT